MATNHQTRNHTDKELIKAMKHRAKGHNWAQAFELAKIDASKLSSSDFDYIEANISKYGILH